MRYLSLCSGIEAASVAWQSLGWQAVAFAEIEPFPCAILAHHYPDVPNLGDISKIDGRQFRGTIDVIIGGTPCQDFSIAGKRAGLGGERSGLAHQFIRILSECLPQWFVWENVPGVFSTGGGADFKAILNSFDECGYSCAWRVLDAQFFGVPQRRRRVFVVGHLGDWRHAAKVLFEQESLRRNFTQGGKEGKGFAKSITGSTRKRGGETNSYAIRTAQTSANGHGIAKDISHTLDGANGQAVAYAPSIVEQAMSCKWAKGSSGPAGDEHHNLIAVQPNAVSGTLCASGAGMERSSGQTNELDMLVLATQQGGAELCIGLSPAITAAASESGNNQPVLFHKSAMQVRRLTPRECERLQGFPDDYTNVLFRGKPATDSPRYKALGNSMAVPVIRWLGERISMAGGAI